MRANFTINGLSGLTEDLLALQNELRARVIAATSETKRRVIATAQANAPRDRGDLARAIQGSGTGLVQRVGLVDQDLPTRGGKNAAHRNPSVYGVWYEYGFKTRTIARHEFMGPAADAEEGPHQDRLAAAINGVAG